eukprot:CAMPEP_0206234586 /NCGR_PEP_ID=MMETSP0047_2-20121206/12672_1 /ASSEMBLY_ACC=CAM_ASM_000192 /TAXON_ID=195065 /ORGANISM="Chroomonas mesostigmatica_cf, Strain CCMP1168" /LENGTH=84 /DNA_ID=CAMNT_0053658687 /DNA_START=108 /DNA_END=362 /DNA_ORIENTATION=-
MALRRGKKAARVLQRGKTGKGKGPKTLSKGDLRSLQMEKKNRQQSAIKSKKKPHELGYGTVSSSGPKGAAKGGGAKGGISKKKK